MIGRDGDLIQVARGATDARLKRLAKPGDWVMKFLELEGQDGGLARSISFVGMNFKPLSYSQLAGARLHEPITVPLDWQNAKVVEADIEGLDIDQVAQGNAMLQSTLSSTTVSLQPGGWLPSGLAVARSGSTILPDRNVISQIRARFNDGAVVGAGRDFLDLLCDLEVLINPLLFAMEGNGREIPAPELVASQLAEAINFVAKALPKAKLVIGPDTLRGALGMIEDSRPGFERKMAFLLELAPALTAPTSERLLDVRWQQVLDAAERHDVRRDTLVVLAALSCAAVPKGGSVAKSVLKFRPGYTAEHAYNALADLRSLEILMNLFALFPEERPTIFTADKPLALFWTGLQAHNFRGTTNGVSFDLAPVEELLPGAALERWQSAVLADG